MKNVLPKFQAIMAAVLFGINAPLAKMLLGNIEPVLLAAFLYLGCGFGLLLYQVVKSTTKQPVKEAKLEFNDLPWLSGSILAGGVVAPIILMLSLKNTPAATASLLLNFEGVATTIIAAIVFKESLGKRVWIAVGLITFASIILTWDANGTWGFSIGAIGVIFACAFWGIDNNFTRNISSKDPLIIVTIKGIVAGSVSLFIALLSGNSIPDMKIVLSALLLGCLSYGISIILFIFSMRSLGAARTSAFFSSAPFIGTIISLILFREWAGLSFILSVPMMVYGAIIILWEDHVHIHKHDRIEHNHRHTHDDNHHFHKHGKDEKDEHSHWHVHEELEHEHSHTPDIHHRHSH